MTQKAASYMRMAGLAIIAGVAFNVSQRVLDYALDGVFKHIEFLAWLAN